MVYWYGITVTVTYADKPAAVDSRVLQGRGPFLLRVGTGSNFPAAQSDLASSNVKTHILTCALSDSQDASCRCEPLYISSSQDSFYVALQVVRPGYSPSEVALGMLTQGEVTAFTIPIQLGTANQNQYYCPSAAFAALISTSTRPPSGNAMLNAIDGLTARTSFSGEILSSGGTGNSDIDRYISHAIRIFGSAPYLSMGETAFYGDGWNYGLLTTCTQFSCGNECPSEIPCACDGIGGDLCDGTDACTRVLCSGVDTLPCDCDGAHSCCDSYDEAQTIYSMQINANLTFYSFAANTTYTVELTGEFSNADITNPITTFTITTNASGYATALPSLTLTYYTGLENNTYTPSWSYRIKSTGAYSSSLFCTMTPAQITLQRTAQIALEGVIAMQ